MTMWEYSAQERQAAMAAFFEEHGFHQERLDLARDDEERLAILAMHVLLALRAVRAGTASARQAELLDIVRVWETTAWLHDAWLAPGRRLLKMLELHERLQADDVAAFDLASRLSGSGLRLVSDDAEGAFNLRAVAEAAAAQEPTS